MVRLVNLTNETALPDDFCRINTYVVGGDTVGSRYLNFTKTFILDCVLLMTSETKPFQVHTGFTSWLMCSV